MSLEREQESRDKGGAQKPAKMPLSQFEGLRGTAWAPSSKALQQNRRQRGKDTGRGEGRALHSRRHLSALGTEESEAGMPHSPVQPQTLLTFNHALPPQGRGCWKNEEHSHTALFTLTPLWSRLGFSFFLSFFCLSNYFSTFKTWRRFQKLRYLPTGSDYSLFLLCVLL